MAFGESAVFEQEFKTPGQQCRLESESPLGILHRLGGYRISLSERRDEFKTRISGWQTSDYALI